MKKIFYMVIFFSLCPSSLLAGAWGVKSFENDSALDWVNGLEYFETNTVLKKTLMSFKITSYIDLDTCSEIMGAAEVVAAIKNSSYQYLPEVASNWVQSKNIKLSPTLVEDAIVAIEKCQSIAHSELAGLWADSGSSDEWIEYVSNLKKRLR